METETLYSGVAVLLTFTILVTLHLRRTSKKPRLPPSGPLALPIIGHLHLLRQPLHQTLAAISSRYGPILLLRFGLRRVLVLSSPSAVVECLTKNDVTFANRPFLLAGHYFGRGHSDIATAPYGPHWRNQRRVTTLHVFSSARIAALSSARAAGVLSLVNRLFDNGFDGFRVVNMKERLSELTFNTVVGMLGGKEAVVASEGQRFRRVIEEALYLGGASNLQDFFPFVRWVGVKGNARRMERVAGELDEMLRDMMEKRRRYAAVGREEKTIIEVMLELQETEPEYYTDEVIIGMIRVLILEELIQLLERWDGHYLFFSTTPKILKKARDEIELQLGNKRLLTDSDLSRLPYLHNVIKETLRLFPAGPLLIPHYSSEDCIVGGYHIPGRTMLLINAYAMHRGPKSMGRSYEFRPERFEGGEAEGYKYIPFGSGRRRCPGEGMAMRMTALALGTLIQCFEWKRIGDEQVSLEEGSGLTCLRQFLWRLCISL